jgi:hypothetical protein
MTTMYLLERDGRDVEVVITGGRLTVTVRVDDDARVSNRMVDDVAADYLDAPRCVRRTCGRRHGVRFIQGVYGRRRGSSVALTSRVQHG